MVSGPDIPSDFPISGAPASAPIEMIDIVFALSNVKLVREIVQDNLQQTEQLADIGKGQTEGLRAMILQKQRQALDDLTGVEGVLTGIVDEALKPHPTGANRDISLNSAHSKALIYALTFAIGHLMKFIPQQGGQVPGTMI